MKFFVSTACLLCSFLLTISVFPQNPQITPTPTPSNQQKTEENDIIRISSNLVLVDALVLDKEGNQITNLSAEDFEVIQIVRTKIP